MTTSSNIVNQNGFIEESAFRLPSIESALQNSNHENEHTLMNTNVADKPQNNSSNSRTHHPQGPNTTVPRNRLITDFLPVIREVPALHANLTG